MTEKEIIEKIKELIKQLPENRNAFVLLCNQDDEKDIKYFGVGCAACQTTLIAGMFVSDLFQHNGKDIKNFESMQVDKSKIN